MKWLILLGLLFILGAIIAVRYRRQIQTAIYLWKMFRKMRQVGKPTEKQIQNDKNNDEVPLVKCAKCGIWIQQENAFSLRSRVFYCSANCMENAVKIG